MAAITAIALMPASAPGSGTGVNLNALGEPLNVRTPVVVSPAR
jgi:hypothetical protein